jgi:hypothetical protein
MRRRIAILVALVALLALGGGALTAPPAWALTQQSQVVHVDDSFSVSGICSFPIDVRFGPGDMRVSLFFDANGTLVKEVDSNFGGPFPTSISGNGVTLTSVATFAHLITFNPDGSVATLRDSGIDFIFTVPGQGAVVVQTGTVVFDKDFNILFEGGPHPFNHGDFGALCAALGG